MASFAQRVASIRQRATAAAMGRPLPPQPAAGPSGGWFEQNAPPQAQRGLGGRAHDVARRAAEAEAARRAQSQPAEAGGGTTLSGDPRAILEQLTRGKPANRDTMFALTAELKKYGITVGRPNASGDITKVQLPDGSWVRVTEGSGGPGAKWTWVVQPTGAAGGEPRGGPKAGGGPGWTPGPDFGAPPPPYKSAPSPEAPYTTPPLPTGLDTPYTPPPLPADLQTPFTPPSAADLLQDPGYQARVQLANQGLERSAAAKGTVLSGGFQQALAKYNQDYASNEYQNLFGRALGGRQQRMGEYQAGVENALGGRQQQMGEYQTGVGNAQSQYGNRYQAYLNDQQRLLQDYMTNYGIKRGSEQDLWGRHRDLYRGGIEAAANAQLG